MTSILDIVYDMLYITKYIICLVLIIVLSIDYVIRPDRDKILKNLLISPLWWICICFIWALYWIYSW